MRDITEIDHNFKNENKVELSDVCFYNVKENSWCLFGLINDGIFRRMPENVAVKVNEGVCELHTNTSGGRLRFSTDSPCVAICATMPDEVHFSHMPNSGISGFDMYADGDYVRTFIPPVDLSGGYEAVHHFPDSRKRDIMIHFPLYNNVKDLYIGLQNGYSFKESTPYRNDRKVIFYGSSITQGGCVSRPGLAYPAQVSLKLNCDFLNLGFSASAKGEVVMAEYIAGLKPDIFVMDYDHNAPTPEFLEDTHEGFFKAFRNIQKNVPVIFMTAPNARFDEELWTKRRKIVYRTYGNAVTSGDRNVYFVDGKELWGDIDWQMCSADALHPNDIGHYRMAQRLLPVIQKIMEKIK